MLSVQKVVALFHIYYMPLHLILTNCQHKPVDLFQTMFGPSHNDQ